MERYGHIFFPNSGEQAAKDERIFCERMRTLNVIQITDEKLDEYYKENCLMEGGLKAVFGLHNQDEIDAFKTVAESEEIQKTEAIWKISKRKCDDKFDKKAERLFEDKIRLEYEEYVENLAR